MKRFSEFVLNSGPGTWILSVCIVLFGTIHSSAQVVVGGNINGASDVAVGASGNIYGTAQYVGSIVVIEPGGTAKYIGKKGNSDGDFFNPSGIVIDANENIYVAEMGNSRIQKLDKNGNFISKVGVNNSGMAGIAIDANGRIAVTLRFVNKVTVYNSDFTEAFSVGTSGNGNSQFNEPYGIAFDANGNFYVADKGNNRVQVFSNTGTYLSQITTKGAGTNLNQPFTVEVNNSKLYISDISNGLHRYDLQGNFEATENTNIGNTLGLAFDNAGNKVIASPNNNKIAVCKPNGDLIKEYGGTGNGDGQLYSPSGIAYLSNGDAVVNDRGNFRIQLFSSTGVFKSKFSIGNFFFNDIDVSNNKIYALDNINHNVKRYLPDGTLEATINIAQIDANEFKTRMAVDGNGDIWLTSSAESKIRKYNGTVNGTVTGSMLLEFGTAGSGAGQFKSNMGCIGVDQNQRVYVSDFGNTYPFRIQYFDLVSGVYSYGGTIGDDFTTTFAVGGNNLFTVHYSDYYIKQYNVADGSLLQTASGVGLAPGFTNGVSDVEFNPATGLLYLSENSNQNNRIQVIPSAPKINIQQGGVNVANGSVFDVGSHIAGSTVTSTFTIFSQGLVNLNLTGNPKVQISGSPDFVVDQSGLFSATISGNATFKVTYTPSIGTKTATITIPNNDTNISFTITGTGTGNTPQAINNFNGFAPATYGDLPIALGATASSTLPVTYSSSNTAVATVTGTPGNYSLTIVGKGDTQIEVKQNGDATYQKVSKLLTLTVSPKALSGTVTKIYDRNTDAVLDGGLTGLVANDQVSVGSLAFVDSNVGNNKAITATLTGAKANNYTLTVVGKITAKPLTITGMTASNKTYDGLISATKAGSGTIAGVIAGDDVTLNSVNAVAQFNDKNAGNGKTVSFTGFTISGAQAANYSLTQPGTTASISVKALTITGATVSNKVYDGTATATINATGALSGLVNSQEAVTLVKGVAQFADKNAANNKTVTLSGYTISGNDAGNYSLAQPPAATATITKASLVVKAENTSRLYNTANPVFNGTYTGFVNGETATVLSGSASFGTSATQSSVPGPYVISADVSGLSSANYQITGADGTLTINKADQTITFPALLAKKFGDAAFTLSATASSGLAVTYMSSNLNVATISGNTVTIIGAGTSTITASQAGNGNYNAATNVPQTLTVNKLDQTITFNALPAKNQGDAAFSVTATSTSGLPVVFSIASGPATISNNTITLTGAGTVAVKASHAGSADYNAALDVVQSFCVNPSKPTITVSFSNPEVPLLTSSSSQGNQWYNAGIAIANATNATYGATAAGAYTVKVTIGGCTSASSDVQTLVITGLENKESKFEIVCSPNPANATITISHQGQEEIRELKIMDATGQLMQAGGEELINKPISIEQYRAGLYLVRIKVGSQIITRKFLKN